MKKLFLGMLGAAVIGAAAIVYVYRSIEIDIDYLGQDWWRDVAG